MASMQGGMTTHGNTTSPWSVTHASFAAGGSRGDTLENAHHYFRSYDSNHLIHSHNKALNSGRLSLVCLVMYNDAPANCMTLVPQQRDCKKSKFVT